MERMEHGDGGPGTLEMGRADRHDGSNEGSHCEGARQQPKSLCGASSIVDRVLAGWCCVQCTRCIADCASSGAVQCGWELPSVVGAIATGQPVTPSHAAAAQISEEESLKEIEK